MNQLIDLSIVDRLIGRLTKEHSIIVFSTYRLYY